jgi:hypothetical protein
MDATWKKIIISNKSGPGRYVCVCVYINEQTIYLTAMQIIDDDGGDGPDCSQYKVY